MKNERHDGEHYVDRYLERAARDKPMTAYHEASHIVASYLLLAHVGAAEIVPDLTFAGRAGVGDVDVSDRWAARRDGTGVSDEVRLRIERVCVTFYAGRAAEERARSEGLATPVPDPSPPVPFDPERAEWDRILEEIALDQARRSAGLPPARTDEEKADDLIERISGDEGERLIYAHLLGYRARLFVRDELVWRLISSVATALLDADVMSGADVETVIRREMEAAGAPRKEER